MSEQKKSSEAKKPAQSNSSRSIAIGAVALLIVIAIAGIVLARRGSGPPGSPTAATPGAAASAVSARPPRMEAPSTAANPNEVPFPAGSARLSAEAGEVVSKFAGSVRTSSKLVRMSARFVNGENKAKDIDLAKARTAAVREALLAGGVARERMQVELVEMPVGSLTEASSNRIDLSLR